MVVKDKIGRRRYIAFEIVTKRRVEKREIVRLLHDVNSKLQSRKHGPQGSVASHNFNHDTVRLIKFDNAIGLIYCMHYDKDGVIELLTDYYKRIDGATLRILGISGTIRKATKKYLDKLNDYP